MPMPTEDKAAIAALYSQMHQAMVTADITALATLLTDDFHLVHMTGYDQPRAGWLAHIASGRMRYFSSAQEQVVVRVDGDSAKLRGRNRVKADIWGARGTWPLQLDIGLVRRDGRWWMCAAHASTY